MKSLLVRHINLEFLVKAKIGKPLMVFQQGSHVIKPGFEKTSLLASLWSMSEEFKVRKGRSAREIVCPRSSEEEEKRWVCTSLVRMKVSLNSHLEICIQM